MRDDETFPSLGEMQDESAKRVLWLRQSVTFSVNGQTRTLEMALPVRPGAPAEELEALLDEADAGMRRLSRRLDTHIADAQHAQNGGRPAPIASEGSSVAPIAAVALTPAATPQEHLPQSPAIRPAERPAELPARPTPEQRVPTQPTSAAQPATVPAVAGRPTAEPTQPSARPQPATPQPTATAEADMSRAEFLAAAGALGLNPKQAMDRLGVRSLSGLNLREALATLQRLSLRANGEAGASAAPKGGEPAGSPPAQRAPTRPEMQRPATPSHPLGRQAPTATRREPPASAYGFEEEDEPDLAFGLPDEPDDLEDADDFAPVVSNGRTSSDTFDDFDADDPDALDELNELSALDALDEFLAPIPPAGATEPAARIPPTVPPAAPVASVAASDVAAAEAGGETTAQARVRQRIQALRSARGGGIAVAQQRTAYRNIVVEQIGESVAAALIRGVWRITPDRLGPEQYDELIRWGKEDDFAEEVPLVIAALRAERAGQTAAHAAQAPQATPTEQPAPVAPTPPASAPTRAPRRAASATNTTGAANREGASRAGR